MMPLKKKRRIQIIALASVALLLSTGLIGYAMRDGINFFRSPSQIVSEAPGPAEVFRIGGLVEEGSVVRGQGDTVTFRVTDCAVSIPVSYTGILPDLFAENESMVGQGTYTDGTFTATEVLAKHDENYMPKEVAQSLQAQGVDPETTQHSYSCKGTVPGQQTAQGSSR
jgi:cytochrome c-type biogenesis protein CcmE